jgi:hypothetical protein
MGALTPVASSRTPPVANSWPMPQHWSANAAAVATGHQADRRSRAYRLNGEARGVTKFMDLVPDPRGKTSTRSKPSDTLATTKASGLARGGDHMTAYPRRAAARRSTTRRPRRARTIYARPGKQPRPSRPAPNAERTRTISQAPMLLSGGAGALVRRIGAPEPGACPDRWRSGRCACAAWCPSGGGSRRVNGRLGLRCRGAGGRRRSSRRRGLVGFWMRARDLPGTCRCVRGSRRGRRGALR